MSIRKRMAEAPTRKRLALEKALYNVAANASHMAAFKQFATGWELPYN